MGFVDEVTVFARAGRGGDGSASVLREPYTPRGGPDGGDGGRGGDVVFEVSKGIRDLSELADHPHPRAANGRPGGKRNRTGAQGEDLVVAVPDGTRVEDEEGLVADLVGDGARAVVARGGRGGRGSSALASPRDRVPQVAEAGEPGEEKRFRVELRTVADIGLVGLPNAGKSTLLAALTAARPKIADYPFTTLTPNLGVADVGQNRFIVADIPGLIEGAHEGRGLGDRFLRHVSRCRALVLVVDLSSVDPAADLAVLRAELAAYDSALAARPSVVVGTKIDLAPGADPQALLAPGAIAVSAVSGEGVQALRERLERLAGEAAAVPEEPSLVVLRPARPRFVIRREGERFRVVGRGVERWVSETDLEDPRKLELLQKRLVREGVERQLALAGARRGDEVVIGDVAFEFIPEETGGPA
ncbi:MAG TPA: GTPase ObgE [Actinomycetota bacterium]|nr:GTPase ObgE [Actinomycetota bacterium]